MFDYRIPVAALATALALASTALAQDKLSKGDREWMEEEVGAIITEREKALFQEIDKDDRKLFKELFWMRRDFDPSTSKNEFKEAIEARIDSADDNFEVRGRKGRATDRGRVFVLLGPPTEQSTSGETLTWTYEPNESMGLPDGLSVRFRKAGELGFRMLDANEVNEKLERVKGWYISNPAVNYTRNEKGRLRKPDDRFDPNSPAKQILRAMQETGETSDAVSFRVKPHFFRSSAGQTYIPMDLVVTSELSGDDATVFGAIENADGRTVQQFEEFAKIEEDKRGTMGYEMPLQLEPGLYTMYVGILDVKGQKHGSKILDLEVPDFDDGELSLSSVIMFSEADQTGEASGAPGKAFMLGGYHFFPKRELVYTKSDMLSGVFNAYNYGISGENPNLTIQVSFSKDGQKRGQTGDDAFMLQTPEMALTIFDIPLNLPNFSDPGDYKVQIKVTDHVKGETLTKEFDITIEGD